MNMAMKSHPRLPTPYPVGVSGVTDWVNAPFDWAASLFVSTPPVVGITPQAQAAITQGFATNQAAISAKAPGIAATIQSAIQSGNWDAASRNLSVGTSLVSGDYDKALERERMRQIGIPDSMSSASQWLVNNWKWLALLGGGAITVKYLMKRN